MEHSRDPRQRFDPTASTSPQSKTFMGSLLF